MLIHHLEGSIVASTGAGHCGVSLVEAVASAAPELLAAVPGACWLIDLARVNGADVGCHRPGSEIFRLFRERGGRALALVVPSNTLRMVITAGAFAAGISFKVFDQRATALAYLRDLEARPAARPAA